MLKKFTVHEEHLLFQCPCGGVAIGMFALPTNRRQLAIIGVCPSCIAQGADPTTIAYLACEQEDWKALMSVRHVPVLRGNND